MVVLFPHSNMALYKVAFLQWSVVSRSYTAILYVLNYVCIYIYIDIWGAIPCGNQERGTCMMMSIGPFCWQVIDDLSLEFSGNISSLQQFLSDLTYVPFAGAQGFKGEIEWRFFVDRMPPLKR